MLSLEYIVSGNAQRRPLTQLRRLQILYALVSMRLVSAYYSLSLSLSLSLSRHGWSEGPSIAASPTCTRPQGLQALQNEMCRYVFEGEGEDEWDVLLSEAQAIGQPEA